jgi:hypothetical protein
VNNKGHTKKVSDEDENYSVRNWNKGFLSHTIAKKLAALYPYSEAFGKPNLRVRTREKDILKQHKKEVCGYFWPFSSETYKDTLKREAGLKNLENSHSVYRKIEKGS